MRTLHATESHSATIPHLPIVTWGGAVAAQVRSQMASQYDRSNGSFHRVLACSAGGPGFNSWLRHSIIKCSIQKDVDGSGQASTKEPFIAPSPSGCLGIIGGHRYSVRLLVTPLPIQRQNIVSVTSLCYRGMNNCICDIIIAFEAKKSIASLFNKGKYRLLTNFTNGN